ncbi:lectin C-type domain protein [Necator americanus]|uniref:Lectin C-type domain protein n=1 Tax=Necator americanus TaxID=51031 RepID=W2TK99_NECAM|nr:lectin C-type domain protein [Necator americanus]ETN82505.1 lectin C-type domain protein [Necator americanus]
MHNAQWRAQAMGPGLPRRAPPRILMCASKIPRIHRYPRVLLHPRHPRALHHRVFHDAAFDQAETVCTSTGGHLTSIHSDEENAFVLSLTHMGIEYRNEKQLTWIGLRKPNYPANATWAWTDGSKVDYFNWAPGKPENITGLQDCAQMYTDSLVKNPVKDTDFKRWNDVQCSLTMRAYVCKEAALH